ncbi:MarR family transcriptional regulator [Streptomyces sp. SID10853]|nr:MarR family transcriptional regulator [Streptomyces sp. SID10853]
MRWIVWVQRKGSEEWFRERDLSSEQAFVLGYLIQNPGSIQRDIARVSRTSAASVSSLLKGMERRGLIERRMEEGDDRSKRVFVTSHAREVIDGLELVMTEVEHGILAPLDAAERASLHALLTKVTAELSEPTLP